MHRRVSEFRHQPVGGVLARGGAGPDQHVDDDPIVTLRDAARDEAGLIEQPGVDFGVGRNEVVDGPLADKPERSHLDGFHVSAASS